MESGLWSDLGAVWPLARLPWPGGERLVVAGQHGGVRVWDPLMGTLGPAFDVRSAVNDMVVCQPPGLGPVLVVATEYGVEWFDAHTSVSLYGPTTQDTVWGMTAAAATDGTVTVFGAGYLKPHPVHRWDASTGVPQPDLGVHDDHIVVVTALHLPDGTILIATAGWAGTIHRWNPATDQPYGQPLAGHNGVIVAMDVVRMPDRRLLLASADSDGQVRRWDPVTGIPIGEPFTAHLGATTVTFARTSTGICLLTSGDDETIRRWDPITGTHLGDLGPGYAPVVLHVDGTPTVAAGGSQGLHLYPLPD